MNKIYQNYSPDVKNPVKRKFGGFTLIELLVTVLVIGILAAMALPQYQKSAERSRATEAMTNLRALVTAEKIYKMANGSPVSDLSVLDLQLSGTMTDGKIVLPYFTYEVRLRPGQGEEFEVVANRNSGGNDLMKYYVYYSYAGSYECVAKHKKAKNICSAICASGNFHPKNGFYYCSIR